MAIKRIIVNEDEKELIKKKRKLDKEVIKKLKALGFTHQEAEHVVRGF